MDFAIVLGLFGYLFIAGAFQFDWLDDPITGSGASGNEADPGASPAEGAGGLETQPVEAFMAAGETAQSVGDPQDGAPEAGSAGAEDAGDAGDAGDAAVAEAAPAPRPAEPDADEGEGASDPQEAQAAGLPAGSGLELPPDAGAALWGAAADLPGGAALSVGADGAPAEMDGFRPGEELLLIAMNAEAVEGGLDVQVLPSENGQDGLVFVEKMLIAVLKNAPDASPQDIMVALTGAAAG